VSTFAIDLQWLHAPSVAHPIERLTWAEISIRVGGLFLTRLLDPTTNSVRNGFYGSSWPLAEWVAANALRLIHERREPRRLTEEWFDWRDGHALRVARGGNAMPDLFIRRVNERWVELNLRRDTPLPGVAVRFLEEGRFHVEVDALQRGLFTFLRAVQERLGSSNEPGRAFFDRSLESLSADRFGIIAARLGLPGEWRAALSDAELAVAEASAAPTPELRLEEAAAVARQLPAPRAPDDRWLELSERIERGEHGSRPWLTGWAAAGRIRDALGLPPEALSAEVFERASLRVEDVRTVESLGTQVDSVHVRAPSGPPTVVTVRRERAAHRFRLGRSLFHALFGGASVVAESPLLRSSEANACAAELLAPVRRLESRRPTSGAWRQRDLDDAAREFGAAPDVVRHQIENHRELGEIELDA
jgi:hypothetical protein